MTETSTSEGHGRRPRRGRPALVLVTVGVLVAAVAVSGMVLTRLLGQSGTRASAGTSTTPPSQPVATVQVSGRPMRVLFVGDSLTFGSYASTPTDAFRARVMAGVRRSTEATTSSVGGAGRTSASVTRFVRSQSYDLVVVETGTNDAAKERPENVRPSYAKLLSTVRRASPGAVLVCVGSWLGRPAGSRVDEVIQSECRRAGGVFVAIEDLYSQPGLRGPAGRSTYSGTADDFHPNDAGHKAIADRILGVIRVEKVG